MRRLRILAVAGLSSLVALLSLLVVVEGAGRAGTRTITQSVARIDKELAKQWKKAGIEPAPAAGDEAFIRRVTLDLIGRIPTVDEVEAYVADKSKPRKKKEALVDRLLASDDYAEHWADVYMDVLFTRASRVNQRFATPPRAYLAESFAANEPFDEMAVELIAGRGDNQTNGATSFVLSLRPNGGNVELLAGETARIFLGVGIQCAQCHDHPYDERYKKADFAAFAANFAETLPRAVDDPLFGRTIVLTDADKARGPYASDVPAMFGQEIVRHGDETRREALARAVVDSDLFALVTVNRTWQQLFGAAVVSPWDELGGENDPSHTPLLRTLAEDFQRSGFDHHRLVKVIVLSKAYGLASTHDASDSDTNALESAFAVSTVRPLSPDQLLRSQLVATGLQEAFTKVVGADKAAQRRAQFLRDYLITFTDDEGASTDVFSGNIPKTLLMRNGVTTNRGVRARKDGPLWTALRASDDPEERIAALFTIAYSRTPSDDELAMCVEHLESSDGKAPAYEDLFHALITSIEFTTNH